jgi:hypothetical protein
MPGRCNWPDQVLGRCVACGRWCPYYAKRFTRRCHGFHAVCLAWADRIAFVPDFLRPLLEHPLLEPRGTFTYALRRGLLLSECI